MENKKAFGEYIRQKRMEAGLTQRGFADRLFVTESAVSKWERGLSYPDITLVGDICEILQLKEHELLTASEDVEARSMEKLAVRYLRLIRRLKTVQYLLYGLSLLICFICNLAVQHTLSWFFLVLVSELTAASLTLLPILITKKRGLVTLFSFTASLLLLLMTCCLYTGGDWFFIAAIPSLYGLTVAFLPYLLSQIWLPAPLEHHRTLLYFAVDTLFLFPLLLVCDLYTKGGWFLPVAVPIAGFCLLLPWCVMLVIRYTKMNGFFKASASLAFSGLFFFFLGSFLDVLLEKNIFDLWFILRFDFRNWSEPMINANVNAVIFFSLCLLAVLFLAAGIAAGIRRKRCAEKQ